MTGPQLHIDLPPITVKQLIKELKKAEPNASVMFSIKQERVLIPIKGRVYFVTDRGAVVVINGAARKKRKSYQSV
jgi:hypothetical protein